MNCSASWSMSSSPANGDPPLDDNVRTCGNGDCDATLLAGDMLFIVAVPMLADLVW
jgi:hypothetical protein